MIGKDICKRIRELRKSMGLTQHQFAELVNLSDDSIGKIERGVAVPTVDSLYKISIGLKMSIADLIQPVTRNRHQRTSKAIDDLVIYLKTRPPEDARFIHELAVKVLERKK